MKQAEVTRTYGVDVRGTSLKIEYRVRSVSTESEEEIAAVFGAARKARAVVGYVNFDRSADRLHISYEPFDALTLKEKRAMASTAHGNIDEFLKAE